MPQTGFLNCCEVVRVASDQYKGTAEVCGEDMRAIGLQWSHCWQQRLHVQCWVLVHGSLPEQMETLDLSQPLRGHKKTPLWLQPLLLLGFRNPMDMCACIVSEVFEMPAVLWQICKMRALPVRYRGKEGRIAPSAQHQLENQTFGESVLSAQEWKTPVGIRRELCPNSKGY